MQVKQMGLKQQGFTIIELVVVILLLGILAATALPRFIDVTTEAHTSVFESNAGALATGIALYRAEWTARGQPAPNVGLQSYGGLRSARGYSEGDYTAAVADPAAESIFTTPDNFEGRSTGYPLSLSNNINKATEAPYTAMTSLHCAEVFENILQEGGAAASVIRAVDNLGAVITSNQNLTGVDETSDTAVDAAATTLRTAIRTSAEQSAADFTAFLATVEIDSGLAHNDGDGTDIVPNNTSGQPRNHIDTVPACLFAYTAEAENYERTILYVPWTGRLEFFNELDDLIVGAQYSGPVVTP